MFAALFSNVRPWRWLLPCAVALTLVACGGGDGGDAADPVALAPPAIEAQPVSATVAVGAPVAFTVGAVGDGPLAYQWQRNGTDVPGATSATFGLASVALADHGATFAVVVSNAAGSIASAGATLSVTDAPVIATPPSSVSVQAGKTATFSVAATAGGPLTYQWLRDGADIAGANASSYVTPAVVVADSGAKFSVRVASGSAATTSSEAVLTVTAGPSPSTGDIVSAGLGFTLALRPDGSVLSLGRSAVLDLTPGTPLAGSSARIVTGVSAVSASAGRYTSLAVGTNGLLYGWGLNATGMLGGEIDLPVRTPRVVSGVDGVQAALTIDSYTLALRNDGTVWHWPGVLTYAPQSVTPRQIDGLAGVRKLAPGMTGGLSNKLRPLAVKTDGTVWSLAWTATTVAGAGGPVQTHTGSATQIAGLSDVRDVSCTQHCLALRGDGSVVAWGRNVEGQLGDGQSGDYTLVTVPQPVPGLAGVRAIGTTRNASVAVAADGRVWTWGGTAFNGQGGAGEIVLPTVLAALTGAVNVSCDDDHCAIQLGDGSLWGWGGNGNGELGDGTTALTNSPVHAVGIDLN